MAKSRGRGTARPTSGRVAPGARAGRLDAYRAKRDFASTPEPTPESGSERRGGASFVVQRHDATRLHYDVRLEIDGALMSFAVAKEPSYDPEVKRLAVETEDHPLAYSTFEGRIPDGQYGAGDVRIWDAGTYETVPPGSAAAMRAKGHLHVRFFGEKLRGDWHFVKVKRDRSGQTAQNTWLFFKAKDAFADASRDAPIEPTSGARALLDRVGAPMLATSGPLDDPSQYAFEIKYDGYRILAAKSGSEVRLESRRGLDWSERFGPVVAAIAALPVRDAVIDGEVCAVTPDGKPSFQRLQQWVGGERREVSIAFAAFDLLWLDGRDLRARPLEERRELLRGLLEGRKGLVSFSTAIPAPLDAKGKPDVAAMLAMARAAGLEGFVAKRKGSPYVSGRSPCWLKLKCVRRQELAVCGYTPLSGRKGKIVGALILAVRDGEVFRYAGKVGTGFDDAQRRALAEALERDRVQAPPLVMPERLPDARWSTPRLVAEVEFMEWSDDGKLRHPSFVALRDDKAPEDCVREDVRAPPQLAAEGAPRRVVRLSNPDKVLYPRDGITKRDVLAYYERIAPVVLPHLRGRPLTLQRWPDGIDGEQWYQQHPPQGTPSWVRTIDVEGERHVVAEDVDTLRWLANLAALTLHVWSAHAAEGSTTQAAIEEDLRHPDWVVIDLDPGAGPWAHVIEVALAIRLLLEKLELPSVVKTTGKRGLHVVVPFARGPSHDDAVRLGGLIATAVAKVLPAVATTERAIPKRKGRLYVDFLQNGHGRTIAAPYTLRALDGAPVSTPIRWSEVTPELDPSAFTLRTVPERIDAHGDLFAGALAGAPDVRPLLARL